MRAITLFLFIALTVLSGCSTTGGTIGGLIPAPKFLKGKIENNTYFANDNSFEIQVPFDQDSYAYKYMAVKEQYSQVGAYVSFNSSVHPNEIYRIEIGKVIDKSQALPSFDKLVEGYSVGYKEQLAGYGATPGELWRDKTTVNGYNAAIVVFKQYISTEKTYHIMYILEQANGIGMISVQWPYACESCESGPESKILEENRKIKDFISSIKLKM